MVIKSIKAMCKGEKGRQKWREVVERKKKTEMKSKRTRIERSIWRRKRKKVKVKGKEKEQEQEQEEEEEEEEEDLEYDGWRCKLILRVHRSSEVQCPARLLCVTSLLSSFLFAFAQPLHSFASQMSHHTAD